MENNVMYTEEQLMARLKFFIGICLSLTLFGIVFVVLYSLIFVTQPLNAISPIDQKFFELIVPIATFLTGTLSGIMLAGTKPEDQKAMLEAQKMAQSNADAAAKNTIAQAAVLNPSTPSPVGTTSPRPPMGMGAGMGMGMSMMGMGTAPVLEPGDPVNRNTRNDQ